jgi:hypothetical protein
MRMARAGTLLVCAVAALLGCAGSRLAPDPPAGLSLAGAWKLDRAASDDPQRVLARMRTEALKRMGQRVVATGPPRGGARGAREERARTAQPEDPGLDADPAPVSAGRGPPPDPLKRSPMARALLASIARGDFLTVRQSPGELVLDYGTSQRRFTPGAHSVVSAESGVADQSCGWKGREYVVEVRAQTGPDVTERYGLSPDGRHLVERLHIAPEELSAVDLTRVYDPTDDTAPRQMPIND